MSNNNNLLLKKRTGQPFSVFGLVFNGTDYAEGPSYAPGGASRTVELWIRPHFSARDNGDTSPLPIFGMGLPGAYNNGGPAFMLYYDHTFVAAGCYLQSTTYSGVGMTASLPVPFSETEFSHIAFRYNQAAGSMDIYARGQVRAQAAVVLNTATAPLLLGATSEVGYRGQMDIAGVRYWSTYRTDAELLANASAALPPATAGLVEQLQIFEPSGATTTGDNGGVFNLTAGTGRVRI